MLFLIIFNSLLEMAFTYHSSYENKNWKICDLKKRFVLFGRTIDKLLFALIGR